MILKRFEDLANGILANEDLPLIATPLGLVPL